MEAIETSNVAASGSNKVLFIGIAVIGGVAILTTSYFLFFHKAAEKKVISKAKELAVTVNPVQGSTVQAKDFFDKDELLAMAKG